MTGVDFWIDTEHIGKIGMFKEPSVEYLLSQVIEFVGINSSLDSDCIVSLLSNYSIKHFCEPPDTCNEK